MADYTRKVRVILLNSGCTFVRHGKGDHEIWYSPINDSIFVVDGSISNRTSANETLKDAGIRKKV